MSKRPNFLWFILDDVSPLLSVYGYSGVKTPNIDRIAEEGCVYENAFATASVCPTSRNSIFTARYQTANGAHHARTTFAGKRAPAGVEAYHACPPPYVKCFTEYLRAEGYFCTNNSKTDYQFGDPSSAWDVCSSAAHWNQRASGQPFFAVFNPVNTNESKLWPENRVGEASADAHFELPPFLEDTPTVQSTFATQFKNIEVADGILGRLVSELEWEDLLDETVIFITSDHGMGVPRFKRTLFDTGTHVPLIVRAPGLVDANTRNDALISLIDLGSTVLSLADIARPQSMHGESFIGKNRSPERKYIYSAQDRIDESYALIRSVRDQRFHYIRHYDSGVDSAPWSSVANNHPIAREIAEKHARGQLNPEQNYFSRDACPPEELYDVQADPWEMTNLIDDPLHSEELKRLRAHLNAWQQHADPWRDVPETEMLTQWWYHGELPETEPPEALVLGYEASGIEPLETQTEWEGPVRLQFTCPTQGASIEYQIIPGTTLKLWKLYAGNLPLGVGDFIIRARAVRYGYKPSPEVSWKIRVDKA
ncbi:MAG: sulfatase family protein [Opitutales bacterium]